MPETLERNLAALSRNNPALADALRRTEARAGVSFEPARRDEALTAMADVDGRAITLASRHAPLTEAGRFAEQLDLEAHAMFVVMGMGLGYHVSSVVRRVASRGLVVVYEPDESLLRAVLEQIDHSDWLAAGNVTIFTGEADLAQITGRLEPQVAHVSQGVQILKHPPTRQLAGDAIAAFAEAMTQFVAYCRTNVATTLVNSAITCRNLAHNLGHYAAGATINDLKNIAAGYPAVCVAAGPSLARNVHELAQPGVRDRVIIIAAQTALKPLLQRGVRPHFVTALDYHEISRRFYDGLPQLDDVTLIAEPKANKAILDHYPGPVRVCRSQFLDTLLGANGRRVEGITAGATVAHLSFYFAQYIGCDPILFIGQDLGFSDGLYYCPGTAIHEVWATEMNPFNTLEMMEWKRIARHKTMLKKFDDVNGRPIYSDEQMVTYLRQFERDFADAPQRIIDATEGGMPKQHATQMALAEALAEHATRPLPALPVPDRLLEARRLSVTHEHIGSRAGQVRDLADAARQTLPILREMLDRQRDHDRMNLLFKRMEKHQKRVAELSDAFALVNELNQIGAFKRVKADRQICVADGADEYETQRKQIERDIENLKWLIDGCEQTLEILAEAAGRLDEQIADQSAEVRA